MRIRVITFFYRLLQAAALPLVLVYLAARILKDQRYWRRLGERFGRLPQSYRQTAPGAVWLHAVSVGEVLSSIELVRRLRAQLPYAPLFVSVATLAGRALAEEKLRELAEGIFYAPLDYCFALRAVLRRLRPRVLVVLETEIWPNLWRETKRAGCALLLINGRISDRAWPRYRRLRWFFSPLLALPDAILAQNELSLRRYRELGAPEHSSQVGGNLKYDFDPNRTAIAEPVRRMLEQLGPAEIWIAASTMPPAEAGDPDEDQVVISAFQRLARSHPRLLLILAPRRPERFDAAAQQLESAGVRFIRRSTLEAERDLALPGVLLLDTIGELAGLFAVADVVFMGGTLARRGGHNILEPAAFGRAVIVGPHMENFPTVMEAFHKAGAAFEIATPEQLAPAVETLLADLANRRELAERARRAAAAEQGATQTALREITARYCEALPRYRCPWPLQGILWLLSRIWMAGGRLKQRLDRARRSELATPVVSVGALSMGGAGKTPFTLWLAQRLGEQGRRPAILMRGYRRALPEAATLLDPGTPSSPARTGDEAQIYLRAGFAVGVGADRATTGRRMEAAFRPDAFLLDDGFQHRRLARDLDIVLVDGLIPADELFPLGRLREPMRALARADFIVITRAETLPELGALSNLIRRFNSRAPVLAARLKPEAWVSTDGRRWPADSPPFARPAAFCGLAQPASFWRTLAALNLRPVWRQSFPDHHRYRAAELRALGEAARRGQADCLLTTEKDLMNLGPGWQACLEGPPLYWLKTRLEVQDQEVLLAAVEALLGRAGRALPD